MAHPNIEQSKVNKALLGAISDCEKIKVHEIYKLYPQFDIDVKKEQSLLVESNTIVFQFPFYWYSSPALLKEWEDKVFTYGFAYGSNGIALKGKKLLITTSTGGDQEAYSTNGANHFTIQQLLMPFEQTAYKCGMEFLRPFVVYGAITITEEKLVQYSQEYRHLLLGLT